MEPSFTTSKRNTTSLSSFSKHSWNELSCLFMESQQSTPGRCCLLSFFTLHVLSKDLSLLAACMYYDADLLRAIEKGCFRAGSLGRMSIKCHNGSEIHPETDVEGFAGSSRALYCSAICCIQILSLVWSLAQHVWDFHHCHKKSEVTHPSLHLKWFLDCRNGLEILKQRNKNLCVYLNRPVPETNRTLSVNEIYLLDSGAQYKWVVNGAEPPRVLFPMTQGSAHVCLGKQDWSGQQIRAADRPCWGQGWDVKVQFPSESHPAPVWWELTSFDTGFDIKLQEQGAGLTALASPWASYSAICTAGWVRHLPCQDLPCGQIWLILRSEQGGVKKQDSTTLWCSLPFQRDSESGFLPGRVPSQ